MKQYANGYDSPVFIIYNADNTITTVYMSFEYQALIEYEEDVTTLDLFTDGSKEDKTHFFNYEWRLFYTDEINYTERNKLRQIQDARVAGLQVELIPHADYPWRSFNVLISAEKRAFELDSYFSGYDATTNKGYEISFVNKDPIYSISIVDPNYIPSIGYLFGEEYFI